MIIHQPELITKDGYSILWSRVELTKENGYFPKFIWYRVPILYGKLFTTQSDTFLISGLLAGMYLGENIEVKGNVSPKLAYQLEEIFQDSLHLRELVYYIDPLI